MLRIPLSPIWGMESRTQHGSWAEVAEQAEGPFPGAAHQGSPERDLLFGSPVGEG